MKLGHQTTNSDDRCLFLRTYVFSSARDSKGYEPVLRTLHTETPENSIQPFSIIFLNSALKKRDTATVGLPFLGPHPPSPWCSRTRLANPQREIARRFSPWYTSGLMCLRRTNTPICHTEFPRSQLGVHNFDPVQSRQGIYETHLVRVLTNTLTVSTCRSSSSTPHRNHRLYIQYVIYLSMR